jgi:3-hydroxyisobutyrate dehydrogenase-like beta-hydroxyacid dehydrogenase
MKVGWIGVGRMGMQMVTREMFQAHFGLAKLQPDPESYLQKDYASLFETMALIVGVKLETENVAVSDGLELEQNAA